MGLWLQCFCKVSGSTYLPSAQERHRPFGAGPEEATKMIPGLEYLSCEEGGESWGCWAWRREGFGQTLPQPSSTWRGPRGRMERDFLQGPVVTGQGVMALNWEGGFKLDIRKKFFTVRVVRPWHRLPREAVAAPSLAVFKARLDGVVSNLV